MKIDYLSLPYANIVVNRSEPELQNITPSPIFPSILHDKIQPTFSTYHERNDPQIPIYHNAAMELDAYFLYQISFDRI